MIVASAIASCLQIAALILAGKVSIEVLRKQTLSKNFEWVLENQDFAKRFDRPGFWPLIISAIIVLGILFYGTAIQSLKFMLWGKTIGILGALGFLTIYYYIVEMLIGRRIPVRKERTASFVKRSLSHYISRTLFLAANITAVSFVFALLVSLILHKISLATFIYDLAGAFLCYGACYGGMLWTINEKIPHKNDIAVVSKENLSENYRKFSFSLLLGMLFCISGLLSLGLGLQWFGYEFYDDPLRDALYRLTGELKVPSHLMSPYLNDIIASVFSIPLFLYIARCKTYRDIRAISVVRQ
jgi:hypothetical protein